MPVPEIGQSFDDPTLADDTALAARRHALKLRAQRRQPSQSRVDLANLRCGQGMRLAAVSSGPVREVEQRADRLALEA